MFCHKKINLIPPSYETLRVSKQRFREAKTQAVDYLILLIAGACLGSLTTASDKNFGFGAYTYTIIAVCKFVIVLVPFTYARIHLVHMIFTLPTTKIIKLGFLIQINVGCRLNC